MINALILTISLCLVVLLGIVVYLRHYHLTKIVSEQRIAIHQIRQDMHALCAGAINLGKHVDALEQKIRRQAERQDQLSMRDPSEHAYAHAIRLAQKGANINELVENCGLARSEAELLLRIHRTQQREAANI